MMMPEIRIYKWPVYVFRYLLWEFLRHKKTTNVISTVQGLYTINFRDTIISKALYIFGAYEYYAINDVLEFFIKNKTISSHPVVIDIGANIGVTSIAMVRSGVIKKAIAIEPEPQNIASLEKNITLNKLEKEITCLPFAVFDTDGQLCFELSDDNFGDHRVRSSEPLHGENRLFQEDTRRTIEVKSRRLDTVVASLPPSVRADISLVWIDVQGAEGSVFSGGHETLSRPIPVVAEIWPYGIRRSVRGEAQFHQEIKSLWKYYWVEHKRRFTCYPIDDFASFYDRLALKNTFANVVFTHDKLKK